MKFRLFLILTFFMVACAPQDQVSLLEKRVYSLSVKNQELENDLKAIKKELQDLKQGSGPDKLLEVRSRQAVFQNRLEELNAELLRISGMLEEMRHSYSADKEETMAEIAALKEDVKKLRDEIRLLGTAKEAQAKAEVAQKKAQETGVDLYQKGLDLIKAKKYTEARMVLEEYIKKFPEGKLVPNAHFWIGECEYNKKRYEEAILAFEKVAKDFPKSNKAPAALLKEGFAFFKLGDPESAKIVWKKLIKTYPKSSQAAIAKKQLERLR